MNPLDVALNTMLDDASNLPDIWRLLKSDAEWRQPEKKLKCSLDCTWKWDKFKLTVCELTGRQELAMDPRQTSWGGIVLWSWCLHYILRTASQFLRLQKPQSLAIAHLVEWLQTVTAAQSKSTRSRKQKLSTIESHHHMDGWSPHSRLCTHPEISLVRFCADFTKILRMRL